MSVIEWSSDGCPNDRGYCRENEYPCIYENDDYKGIISCEDCFDNVQNGGISADYASKKLKALSEKLKQKL